MTSIKVKLIKIVLIIYSILTSVSFVSADTQLDSFAGQLVHGGNIFITGASFGTKPSPGPLKYDDFEQGTNGSDLRGWNFVSQQYINPQYSNQPTRPNSSLSAKCSFPAQYSYGGTTVAVNASNFGITGTPMPHIFLDFWYYYDAVYPYSRNHKLFRIHTNNFNPNIYYNIYCGDTGGVLIQDIPGLSIPNVYDGKVITSQGSNYFARQWRHMQVYLEESTPGQYDGTAEVWIDGVKVADRIRDFWNHEPGDTSRWDKVWFGNFLGHDAAGGCGSYGNAYTYWDNVYVDTTRSRVEICDSKTWDNRGHCEIQIPQAWSQNSITVQVNQGSFIDFNHTLFLYVVDSNGNVNQNGLPLCPGCPSPPRNAR